MVEQIAEIVSRTWLEQLSDVDLAGLLHCADEALIDAEDCYGAVIEEATLPSGMGKLRQAHYRKFNSLTKQLEDGEINIKVFNRKSQDLITTNFNKAYSLGKKNLDDGDLEYLRRASEEEMKYARQFGKDIKSGNMKMPRATRAAMYGQTLNGITWHAKVEEQPDDVRIDWVLGAGEHCDDCIILAANSPYTKWNLPTSPRAGATRCLTHCKCKLRFTTGKLTKRERKDAKEFTVHKEESLSDMLSSGKPPGDLKFADEDQQKHIDNLRNKMNFQRRRIASGKLNEKQLKKAMKLRRGYNMELIEFSDSNKIWDVPLLSVDDILDERHIGRKAIKDIMRHGLDGKSLDKVGKKKLASLLNHYEKAIGETLSEDVIVDAVKEKVKH